MENVWKRWLRNRLNHQCLGRGEGSGREKKKTVRMSDVSREASRLGRWETEAAASSLEIR